MPLVISNIGIHIRNCEEQGDEAISNQRHFESGSESH